MEYIIDNFLDFDVICFTETHLTDNVENTKIMLEGFNDIYRKDCTAHSGGLLTYVASSIHSRRLNVLEAILPESIWVEIKAKTNTYLICNVYRPPHTGVEFWDRLNISLETASEISQRLILLGDINENQLNTSTTKFGNNITS